MRLLEEYVGVVLCDLCEVLLSLLHLFQRPDSLEVEVRHRNWAAPCLGIRSASMKTLRKFEEVFLASS